jgi:ribonuclease HI
MSAGKTRAVSSIVLRMPWQKMRFRGDAVFVHVDDGHRIVLDGEGRAEMKYREADTKTYRPGPANLVPWQEQPSEAAGEHRPAPSQTEPGAAAGKPAKRKASGGTPAVARARAPAGEAELGREAADPTATFHVWTDGACSGNPGPMGIGVVVIAGDQRQELGEYLGVGTNNIAELVAIERGLEVVAQRLKAEGGAPGVTAPVRSEVHVRVYSDSGYAIGLLDKGWKAKANQELVTRIRRGLAAFPGQVAFVKVRGHAGVPENERCDELGREAIVNARRRPATAR